MPWTWGVIVALLIGAVVGTHASLPAADAQPVTMRGDASCDGVVNALDATAVLGYLVGTAQQGHACPLADASINLAVADFDADGSITAGDALLMAQCGTPNASQLCAAQPNASLVWQDEFADDIDLSKWQVFAGRYGNPPRLQIYRDDPQNVRIRNGSLVLESNYDAATDTYYSGMVSTNDIALPENPKWASGNLGWTYGRIEIRAAMPYGRGMWPALWMRPVETVYHLPDAAWPRSGEIDILEYLGPQGSNPNAPIEQIVGNIHYVGLDGRNKQQRGEVDISAAEAQQFHVYAIEWTPAGFTWFVDGEQYHEVTSWESIVGEFPAPFDQSFDIIMNFQVGKWAGPPAPEDFPGEMVIDWVRVWQ